MAEYKGYTVTQEKKSRHVIVSKDGRMVMHVPCTERKTEVELEEMVDFYEKVTAMMEKGELRPIHSEGELLGRLRGMKGDECNGR